MKFIKLREQAALMNRCARWFHEHWGIDEAVYRESIQSSLASKSVIPQWYVLVNESQEIIAGAGVIENDFHKQKECAPNLCALYVKQAYRHQGLASYLLEKIGEDMAAMGIATLYLISDHTSFYERCGWTFWGIVEENDGRQTRLYQKSTRREC